MSWSAACSKEPAAVPTPMKLEGPVNYCGKAFARDAEQVACSDRKVTELPPLKKLPNLSTLDLAGCAIADLSGLERARSLRELFLDDNPVRDLAPLAGLRHLA